MLDSGQLRYTSALVDARDPDVSEKAILRAMRARSDSEADGTPDMKATAAAMPTSVGAISVAVPAVPISIGALSTPSTGKSTAQVLAVVCDRM